MLLRFCILAWGWWGADLIFTRSSLETAVFNRIFFPMLTRYAISLTLTSLLTPLSKNRISVIANYSRGLHGHPLCETYTKDEKNAQNRAQHDLWRLISLIFKLIMRQICPPSALALHQWHSQG